MDPVTVAVVSAVIAGVSLLVTGVVAIANIRHNKTVRGNASEQLKLTRAAELRADRPRFVFTTKEARPEHLVVTGTMTDGPTGVAVAVTWWSSSYMPVVDGVRVEKMGAGEGLGTYQVFHDDHLDFGVPIPPEAEHGEIQVSMQCRELDGDEREWPIVRVVKWERAGPGAEAMAHAKLVRLVGRPVWEPLPDNPDGRSAWAISIVNLDDRHLIDVTAEFWTEHGYNGDPSTPNATVPEVLAPGATGRFALDFGQVAEDGSPPGLTHWRIRWEDVDEYAWCFDQYGQNRPERFTGQSPRPYTS